MTNDVTWDYSSLAASYVKRPCYSPTALDAMLGVVQSSEGLPVCDVGAGTAHLTIPLLERGCNVTAIEPNDEMRKIGQARTQEWRNVLWHKGTGEETGCDGNAFGLVTFGSSFNVTDRRRALVETARILRPPAWFACMWNHRNLEDPFQREIEKIILTVIPDYDYGTRREDQSAVIRASGLFGECVRIEGPVQHAVSAEDWITAWRSHATLARQAGSRMDDVVARIEACVRETGQEQISVPYVTRIWVARRVS